jgi:hypothetical protein
VGFGQDFQHLPVAARRIGVGVSKMEGRTLSSKIRELHRAGADHGACVSPRYP